MIARRTPLVSNGYLARSSPEKIRAWTRRQKPLRTRSDRRTGEQPDRARVRAAVLQRDGYRCRLCGTTSELTFHHLRKASAGGAYSESNGICLCAPCNCALEDEPSWAHSVGLVQRAGDSIADCWRKMWVQGLSSSARVGSPPIPGNRGSLDRAKSARMGREEGPTNAPTSAGPAHPLRKQETGQ